MDHAYQCAEVLPVRVSYVLTAGLSKQGFPAVTLACLWRRPIISGQRVVDFSRINDLQIIQITAPEAFRISHRFFCKINEGIP